MKPLYTQEQFNDAKSRDKLPCECYVCKQPFYKVKYDIQKNLNSNTLHKIKFCSPQCTITKQEVQCVQCDKIFSKSLSQIKKTKNNFCSKSCAGLYNSTHKTHGTRRSKLELYLEQQLTSLYPYIKFQFNKKDIINSELDIYIPSLKLAFELNGIFHYEPIFGTNKLSQTQNNDQRKFQACIEQGISLCIIDTSKQKYFKESTSKEFLSIITDIINNMSKN
jgi:hypothetical protein